MPADVNGPIPQQLAPAAADQAVATGQPATGPAVATETTGDEDGPAVAMDDAAARDDLSDASFTTAHGDPAEDDMSEDDYQLASQVIPRLRIKRAAVEPPTHGYHLGRKKARYWTVEQVNCIAQTRKWFACVV